jgi:hypothetical protein
LTTSARSSKAKRRTAPGESRTELASLLLSDGFPERAATYDRAIIEAITWPDDGEQEQLASLPEYAQHRLSAFSIAARCLALIEPRMHAEQAADEIVSFAELILDEIYGGREARLQAMPYKEYLATAEWHQKRRAAHKRADTDASFATVPRRSYTLTTEVTGTAPRRVRSTI